MNEGPDNATPVLRQQALVRALADELARCLASQSDEAYVRALRQQLIDEEVRLRRLLRNVFSAA
jgi:hypothetical protein